MAAKKEPRREQYSKEKLAEWREAFNIFDSNGDGDIGVQELGNIMKQLGKAPTDAQLKAIIAEVDADGSGTIDFDEFCAMMQTQEADALPDEEAR